MYTYFLYQIYSFHIAVTLYTSYILCDTIFLIVHIIMLAKTNIAVVTKPESDGSIAL